MIFKEWFFGGLSLRNSPIARFLWTGGSEGPEKGTGYSVKIVAMPNWWEWDTLGATGSSYQLQLGLLPELPVSVRLQSLGIAYEEGKSTNTPHFQSFLVFDQQVWLVRDR